jgi:3-oxoadipate enol-lactonase
MSYARIDGAEVHYTLSGPDGAPVVMFLHGLGSSGDDWVHQTAALGDYRVLTVDLPGHHRSARAARPVSIETIAGTMAQLLAVLSVDRVHAVGLSLGGCVALALALRAPERVASLVLVNSFAYLRPAGLRAAARGAARLAMAVLAPMPRLAALVAREAFPGPHQEVLRERAALRLAANSRKAYLACLAALIRFDVRKRLGAVRCPTLVVAGERDRTVPLAAKILMAGAIPGARLEIVAHSGHVTAYDRPEVLNRLIRDHLTLIHQGFRTSASG